MKKRLFLKIFVLILALSGVAAFIPVEDRLPHPEKATVQFEEGLQIPVRLSVWWYDLRLNTNGFGKMLDFDTNRQIQIPETAIPTRFWRLSLKRILTPFDKWTACENCYGPNVRCSLKLKDNYKVPDKMRLIQSTEETNGNVFFKVSLIPDESKFETREFAPADINRLLDEAKGILSKGNTSNVPNNRWGLELLKVNPVRVECREAALLLWMGGKVGYVIVPDSTSCPAFNMAFISGTEHPHIFKLERM